MKNRPYYALINARHDAGLRQEDLAPLLGVSLRTLSRWETGETVMPFYRVDQVCRALGCASSRGTLMAPLIAHRHAKQTGQPEPELAEGESVETCPDLWAESKGYPGWPATAPYEPQQRWLRANWLRLKAWFGAEYPPAVLVEQVLCVGAQGVVPPEFGAYSAAMYACALDLEQGLDPDGALAAGTGNDLC